MNSLIILNNYLHDLATAFWFVGTFLHFKLIHLAAETGTVTALAPFLRKMPLLNNVALIFILLFGAVRTWFFMEYEWHPAAGRGLINLLVFKHVLLFTAVGIGLWYSRQSSRLLLKLEGKI